VIDAIKPLPARKVVRALENIGFRQIRQKGSHLFMQHPDGRTTLIPIHPGEKIGKGLIRKIINDAELTRDRWFELIADI